MRVGYSFWGFIGPGIIDTPDGGRFFRRTVLQGLAADHEVILLQRNRDLIEAGDDLTAEFTWDTGLPALDALFLEWRWPLPGRNTTPCGTAGHTCDLHRQDELLTHYTENGVRTLIWDLDRVLPAEDPIRSHPNVTVFEPALHPTPGASTLITPVADTILDRADPESLECRERIWPLAYVGNQPGRDTAFDDYFAPAARVHRHRVAGKWTDTTAWPHVNFTGRVGFLEGQQLQREATTTVLLLPERYAAVGHMTQRLPEAVLTGCLPIGPTNIREIDKFVPPELRATSGAQAAEIITNLRKATHAQKVALLCGCIERLDLFRASTHNAVVSRHLHSPDVR